MAALQRRFNRLKNVLNGRMRDLTLVLEAVDKPHNLSAILRTCDACGVYKVNSITKSNSIQTFNSTAQGSQKWVKNQTYNEIRDAIKNLKSEGFNILGTSLNKDSLDYRKCDLTLPTAFVLGTEKSGMTEEALDLIDKTIYIPMTGMVQSLNVSVAAATLLFEAIRQRDEKNLLPSNGEGLGKDLFNKTLFEWLYPDLAIKLNDNGKNYPQINDEGKILTDLKF